MFETTVTVRNPQGIHCRPSAIIVKEVRNFKGTIGVSSGDRVCDPRSILGLIALGLAAGDSVRIVVEGPAEQKVGKTLATLFARKFDFPVSEG